MLSRLTLLLEQNNNLVKSFPSIAYFNSKKGIPEDIKLAIYAHEKTMPGHVRKYNVPEISEVAALIVGELHGNLEIVLRRRSEYDANG